MYADIVWEEPEQQWCEDLPLPLPTEASSTLLVVDRSSSLRVTFRAVVVVVGNRAQRRWERVL